MSNLELRLPLCHHSLRAGFIFVYHLWTMATPSNIDAVLAASEGDELVIDQSVLGALSSIPGLYDGANRQEKRKR